MRRLYVPLIALALVPVWPVGATARHCRPEVRGKGHGAALAAAMARKAERRAKEARSRRHAAYVRLWTERWSVRWGEVVGRWAPLAIEVGWPRGTMETLGYVIARESGGVPTAINHVTGCAGLLQIHPCWGLGSRALIPRVNLRKGLWLYQRGGWRHWGL